MRIPLLTRGRLNLASSADVLASKRRFFTIPFTPKFRNPLPHPARTAVIGKTFSGQRIRVFKQLDTASIQAFRPDLIASPLHLLRDLNPVVHVSKAVVVFTDSCSSPLSEAARDWIWQRFAVPCFEQLLDHRGYVIAEECEVHAGLHVLRAGVISGTLTSVECDCGRTEPRFVGTVLR